MKASIAIKLPFAGVPAIPDPDRPGGYTIQMPEIGEVTFFTPTGAGEQDSVLDELRAFLKEDDQQSQKTPAAPEPASR